MDIAQGLMDFSGIDLIDCVISCSLVHSLIIIVIQPLIDSFVRSSSS